MKSFGLAHFSAIGLAPADLVPAAAEAGFGAVGLRLFPAFPGAPCYSLPQGSAAAREVTLRLDDTGLYIHDIECVVIDAGFDPLTLLPVLEDAAALGARRVSACGQDADRNRLTDSFAALCALAAPLGLAVDLENMGWRPVRTFLDSLSVVQASGASNAGVLVDALHLFRNGGTAGQVAGAPDGLVRHVQLCDLRGPEPLTDEARVHEARAGRFAPGDGELPLAKLMSATPEDAFMSVEVPIRDGDDVAIHLARLAEHTRKVMAS